MHARHRGPGNGYRSNAMGMGGVATASRVSPEGSVRGRGFYSSEYRNYNRGGFGRGQRRQFQPPQPPPRKGDVFMEAGRLAAEYLVSKGLLPPNALFSGKWQNGSLKNQVGDFQSVRSHEGVGMPLSADGRTSADTRVGNAAADIGPGRRRYFDEHNSMGSRNYMGGRRRSGSFKNYGSEWKRELGRSGSWSERARDSPGVEADDDISSGHKNEQQVGKEGDIGLENSPRSEGTPKSDNVGDVESASERNKSIDDPNVNENAISSDTGKILSSESDVEPTDEVKKSDPEGGEVKDESNYDEIEQQGAKEDIAVEPCLDEDNQETKNGRELLRFCRFANIPTKTRSSLTTKSAKFDKDSITEQKDSNASELPKESGVNPEDVPVDSSSINDSSNPSLISKNIDCDVKKAPAVEEEQSLAYAQGQGSSINPMPSPVKSLMQEEQKENNGLSEFGRSASMFMERGEKRPLNDDESWNRTKKPREWAPSVVTQSDGFLGLSNSMETPQTSEEPMTSNMEDRRDQKSLVDMSLFPKSDVACIDYAAEKQFFPGSFKTFDLNLMEASELNENHDTDPIIAFPNITDSGKQAMPVDIDLTMSNNGNASDKYGKWGSHGKDIEVIDLENDSVQEEKASSSSGKRAESEFTGMDGFPNNPHNNNNEIPDVQDGYGLMIMELLGNDIPNCSSVPTDMNSLQNDMGLQDGEEILGDDDYIYKALGEIPTSFLRVWEQPNQEYGKPF